jgi:hypothetical protein
VPVQIEDTSVEGGFAVGRANGITAPGDNSIYQDSIVINTNKDKA